MIRRKPRLSRPGAFALIAFVGIALFIWGCGSSGDTTAAPAGSDGSAVDSEGPAGGEHAYVEPEYAGQPADLTPEEVCELLDEATVAERLDAEVSQMKPGTSQPDCTWYYKLPGGPATTLHVQVMSMDQTGGLLGTEALEWALERAPSEVEITEVEALDVPNGSYEFYASTVIFAIDPAGRIITVAAHSETSEEGRVALTEATLASLAENHA